MAKLARSGRNDFVRIVNRLIPGIPGSCIGLGEISKLVTLSGYDQGGPRCQLIDHSQPQIAMLGLVQL